MSTESFVGSVFHVIDGGGVRRGNKDQSSIIGTIPSSDKPIFTAAAGIAGVSINFFGELGKSRVVYSLPTLGVKIDALSQFQDALSAQIGNGRSQ